MPSRTHLRPSPSPTAVAREWFHLSPLVVRCCVRNHVHEMRDDSALSDGPGHHHSTALQPCPSPSRMRTQSQTRKTTRQTAVVYDIYNKLSVHDGTRSIERPVHTCDIHALLDFFFPHPSLSTTSAPQATRWEVRRWVPRSLSTPIAVLGSPEEGPGPSSSRRGWASRSVIVRDPSVDADVCGLRCVAAVIKRFGGSG